MLQQICEYLHNYFDRDRYGKAVHVETGNFTVENSLASLPFLLDGQRFRIVNSILYDGVYTYHPTGFTDDDDGEAALIQSFSGTICAMAVPPAVIALSGEIKEWVGKYGDIVNSPYQSESVIGVYSYTKANNGSYDGAAGLSWQSVFGSRLEPWRKLP